MFIANSQIIGGWISFVSLKKIHWWIIYQLFITMSNSMRSHNMNFNPNCGGQCLSNWSPESPIDIPWPLHEIPYNSHINSMRSHTNHMESHISMMNPMINPVSHHSSASFFGPRNPALSETPKLSSLLLSRGRSGSLGRFQPTESLPYFALNPMSFPLSLIQIPRISIDPMRPKTCPPVDRWIPDPIEPKGRWGRSPAPFRPRWATARRGRTWMDCSSH